MANLEGVQDSQRIAGSLRNWLMCMGKKIAVKPLMSLPQGGDWWTNPDLNGQP
jgi:hypothetical protein